MPNLRWLYGVCVSIWLEKHKKFADFMDFIVKLGYKEIEKDIFMR